MKCPHCGKEFEEIEFMGTKQTIKIDNTLPPDTVILESGGRKYQLNLKEIGRGMGKKEPYGILRD